MCGGSVPQYANLKVDFKLENKEHPNDGGAGGLFTIDHLRQLFMAPYGKIEYHPLPSDSESRVRMLEPYKSHRIVIPSIRSLSKEIVGIPPEIGDFLLFQFSYLPMYQEKVLTPAGVKPHDWLWFTVEVELETKGKGPIPAGERKVGTFYFQLT